MRAADAMSAHISRYAASASRDAFFDVSPDIDVAFVEPLDAVVDESPTECELPPQEDTTSEMLAKETNIAVRVPRRPACIGEDLHPTDGPRNPRVSEAEGLRIGHFHKCTRPNGTSTRADSLGGARPHRGGRGRWSINDSCCGFPNVDGLSNRVPIGLDPLPENREGLVERPSQIRELVEGCGLDAFSVEVAGDQPVALGPPERLGEHFVGDPIQGVMELLVATTLICKLGKHGESPSTADQLDEFLRQLPSITHG